jgi:cytochrome c-type biogenesis protein CcmF
VALLALTLTVLLGTIFPLAAEAATNRQVTVGGPYFRQTTIPVFLLLLFLMGIGPLLPWRRGDTEQLKHRLVTPALAGAITVAALTAAGARNPAALLAYGLAAFVAVANVNVLVRGVRSYARSSERGVLRSIPPAVARNRRLFGGLIAHLGVVVAVVAITTSSAFARQTEVTLAKGREANFAGYTLRYEDAQLVSQPQRLVAIGEVAVSREGRSIGTLRPSLNFYPNSGDPIGTPSIRYSLVKDLYASLVQMEPRGVQARFRFFLNPGVTWLWIGGAIVVLGGLLAAWPRRRRVATFPRPARRPSGQRIDAGRRTSVRG